MNLSLLLGLLLAAEPPAEKVEPLEKDDLIKAEVAKLQGEWTIVSVLVNGAKASEEDVKAVRRKIEGANFVLTVKKEESSSTVKGKYTLDPTKRPKHIDVIVLDGDKERVITPGIYELDGDTQKVCLGRPDARPDDFSCEEGSGRTLFVWKRAK
jgi:uncharacterized protein (TIGR03067 family)